MRLTTGNGGAALSQAMVSRLNSFGYGEQSVPFPAPQIGMDSVRTIPPALTRHDYAMMPIDQDAGLRLQETKKPPRAVDSCNLRS